MTPEARAGYRAGVTPPDAPGPLASPRHEVTIVDGRFASAVCSCGWRSAGRRSRITLRAEARDHVLLYADGRALPTSLVERDRAEA